MHEKLEDNVALQVILSATDTRKNGNTSSDMAAETGNLLPPKL